MLALRTLFLILTIVVCLGRCKSELFSGAEGIVTLIKTQSSVVDTLQSVLHELDSLRLSLEHTLSIFKEHDVKAKEDPSGYIGNPINSFTLIKRLSIDYNQIGLDMHHAFEKIRVQLQKKSDLDYPNSVDLSGSAAALVRLIDTYRLVHNDLSEGRVLDEQGLPMTSDDCYDFAQELMKVKDYRYAYYWLEEADVKFDQYSKYTLANVYLSMAECQRKLGNLKLAMDWYDYILSILPTSEIATQQRSEILKLVKENDDNWWTDPETQVYHGERYAQFQNVTYEALCRNEFQPDPDTYNRLKCFYKYGKHPFLKIAPFKVEELHPNISLYVYHDVVSDHEIDWIKTTATPMLERAMVINSTSGEPYASSYRTAKSGWISPYEYQQSSKIYRRVADMTDLTMDTAESFQIANYGIGGHYEPHFDYTEKDVDYDETPDQNRISTVLFYLSDVTKGGGTVFLDLGVTVLPKKGSAAFWMNLHPSGEGNRLTRHAACPVLLGYKWVGNVWIHLGGQEKAVPCNLEYQDENEISFTLLKPPIRRLT